MSQKRTEIESGVIKPEEAADTHVFRTVRKRPKGANEKLPDFVSASLQVVTGKERGREYSLQKATSSLGRGPTVDIKVEDEGISREHARIAYSFDHMEFRIQDAESANGTFLNGSRVKEYVLRHGDKILIGETLLQFSIVKEPTLTHG